MMMDSRPDGGKDGVKKEMVCKFFKPDVFKASRNEMKRCTCCTRHQGREVETRESIRDQGRKRGL